MNRFSKVQKEVFRFTISQKILIGLCCFLLIFGIIARFTQGNVVSKFGYDTFSMLRYSLIDKPASTLTGFVDDFSGLWSVRKENDELRSKIASQDMYKAELNETKRKLAELESFNDLATSNIYENVFAEVVSRDVQGWSNSITISKGSNAGVKEDMAVISSKGLIGKVTSVNPNTSEVKLLTTESGDINVSVDVEIDAKTKTAGILDKFNKETGKYEVSIFDSNVKLKKGMKIISSGIGEVFPSGILIGEVSEVSELYNAKGKSISVTPSVDFNSFDYVSVLVNK